MLAVVVDRDKGVTHVIRGDDLSSTTRSAGFRSIMGMGWPVPDLYPHPAHPWRRMDKKLVQAPPAAIGTVEAYRDKLGCLPEGPQELPAAARLVPWRRRDHQREAGNRVV